MDIRVAYRRQHPYTLACMGTCELQYPLYNNYYVDVEAFSDG